jgi:hypothetical protein
MYKELHITYSDPDFKLDPIVLRYQIHNTNIAQKWAAKLAYCIDSSISIDDPKRFYGFNSYEEEKSKAITAINNCIDTINDYSPNFVQRKIYENIDQDTLNYLHHIFEVYHGLLNEPHDFFKNAPPAVQKALGQLNVEVHRCEGLADNSERKQLPTQMVTYYKLEKSDMLDLDDYQHFTDFFEFGTVYLLYTEIGKTLQDLALDDDHYIDDLAYRPFRHYSSDFVIRFYQTSTETWKKMRMLYKKHYDQNKEFYLKRGYNYSHPYNRPGNIPLAKLLPYHGDLISDLKNRQMVQHIAIY